MASEAAVVANPEAFPSLYKSTSCGGVPFRNAILPAGWPAAPPPSRQTSQGSGGGGNGRWVWVTDRPSWQSSPIREILSQAEMLISSSYRSNTSSHYCDNVDDEDDNEEENVEWAPDMIEKQLSGSKRSADGRLIVVEEKKGGGAGGATRAAKKINGNSRLSIILLDQGIFTVYKRLFFACFALNIVSLVCAASGKFPFGRERPALIALWNILALTLCRSEAFLRVVFYLAVALLGQGWVPLFVKTSVTAFLQSVGGIHSGCGVSSVAWVAYSVSIAIRHPHRATPAIVGIAWTILGLLFFSCAAAFPLVRHIHHNAFERIHRFAGWTALALLWPFMVLSSGYDPTTGTNHHVTLKQEFWFTLAITFFIVLPWTMVRKVPVSTSVPSSGHASLIKFDGGVKAGILGRISRSPLSEWHAFGIISDGQNHMMLAGAVGDFTKGLVSDPPSHLWVRSVHFAGLPYLVNMYGRAVLVATGSGICVFLSFLLQPCAADVCVVWVTKGVEQNFGCEIKEMMINGHPDAEKKKVIIHDTAVSGGRPNIAETAIKAAKDWRAEVVVVTSNPQGSRDVVRACKAAGFAAFGPIWDS